MPPDLHRMGKNLLKIVTHEAVVASAPGRDQANQLVERVRQALQIVEDDSSELNESQVREIAFLAVTHADRIFNHPEFSPDFAIAQSLLAMGAWLGRARLALDAAPGEGLEGTTHPGVLGLAGEIYRNQWERTAQWADLRRALAYNARSYTAAKQFPGEFARDELFSGFFTALLLDQLARQEELAVRPGGAPASGSRFGAPTVEGNAGEYGKVADDYRHDAEVIRGELLQWAPGFAEANPDDWELSALVGALFFAGGNIPKAIEWAGRVPEVLEDNRLLHKWLREYVLVAQLRGQRDPENPVILHEQARPVLAALLPDIWDKATDGAARGKLGLALSGGGFRASFYHIGVLARLAESDLLRRIEVLSCVSGGAIVGTYYYMLLKELFETTTDAEVSNPTEKTRRQRVHDYPTLIDALIEDFTRAARLDLRNRIFAWLPDNLRMLGSFSASERLGSLLQKRLLPEIECLRPGGLEPRRVKYLHELRIQPRTGATAWDRGFRPKHQNWQRRNRVPILILNATTVNTGHNWQFTARHMGEPPAVIRPEIDPNPRLRRIKWEWDVVGDELLQVRGDARGASLEVGQAVAASAAVPGIFPPLPIDSRYNEWSIRLSDGGVVDNQGITGLLEQGCAGVVVSDASGRLRQTKNPSGGVVGLFRTSEISMQQIRSRQFEELQTRRRAGLLAGFTYVHLTHGLSPKSVPHIGQEDSDEFVGFDAPQSPPPLHFDVSENLADIRTDLDAFSETEAYALMLSGYRGMDNALEHGSGYGLQDTDHQRTKRSWAFEDVAPLLNRDITSDNRWRNHLARSRSRLLRSSVQLIWMLIAIVAVAAGIAWLAIRHGVALVAGAGFALFVVVIAGILLALLSRRRRGMAARRAILVGATTGLWVFLMATVGMVTSWVLWIGNRLARRLDGSWRVPEDRPGGSQPPAIPG